MTKENYNDHLEQEEEVSLSDRIRGAIGDSSKLQGIKHIDDKDVSTFPELGPIRKDLIKENKDSGKYPGREEETADAAIGLIFHRLQNQ